jgi:basic membrane protein A
MSAAYHGYAAAGVVLGIEIPVLWHFEAGFRYGMDWGLKKYASVMGSAPAVKLLYTYTGTFSDIALGKAASEAMLAQGAVGIYNVAGPLGIGDHEAVAEEHSNAGTNYGAPYYYGVDAFQDWFGAGKHTPVSALKRVDTACYEAVKSVVEGRFVAGLQSLGMSDGGVRLSLISDFEGYFQYGAASPKINPEEYYATVANWALNRGSIPAWIWGAVAELEAGILNETIQVPTANTGAEIAAVRAQYTLGSP